MTSISAEEWQEIGKYGTLSSEMWATKEGKK